RPCPRRLLPRPLQRPPRAGRLRGAGAPLRARLGARALHRRPGRAADALPLARRRRARTALARGSAAREMIATYRLQLTPHFGFDAARQLVPYLSELGVSHLYLSPVLEARRGSMHGYDVVDPTRVSRQLGGERALRRLCEAGLEVILDV